MTNKQPIIGITGNRLKIQDPMLPGYLRAYVNDDYIAGVVANHGVPIVVPIHSVQETIRQQISVLDGLILTGGSDVSPFRYGQEPRPLLGEIQPDRDAFEEIVLREAIEQDIPVLGVCRGLQFINVYHGGTLYQDNSYRDGDVIKHWQGHSPDVPTHHVTLEKNSRIYDIYGEERIAVNSFHHQTIDRLGEGLRAVAHSSDGAIEAVESTTHSFLLGVQWHPEMLFRVNDGASRVFEALIKAASEHRNS